MSNKISTALDNKCPGCGAKIDFDPVTQNWHCKFCGSEFSLEDMQKHNNASSDDNNKDLLEYERMKVDSYTCRNCGATVVCDEYTTSTFCVYCGSTAILKDRLSNELKPKYIIPFKNTKEDAIKAFKGLSKGRPFMPKFFNNKENIEKITGVYIPFWIYDCVSNGTVSFDCVDIRTYSDSKYRYTETRKYLVVKEGTLTFEKIPVDGSSRFADDLMDSIEPFDYKDLVDYNHAYLSGFLAEKYDVDSEQAKERADTRVNGSMIDEMHKSILNHRTISVKDKDININYESFNYILLPVWMVNIKYKDKMLTFAMNGQTGKLVGNIPLNKKKVLLWTILLFTFILIIGIFMVKIKGW